MWVCKKFAIYMAKQSDRTKRLPTVNETSCFSTANESQRRRGSSDVLPFRGKFEKMLTVERKSFLSSVRAEIADCSCKSNVHYVTAYSEMVIPSSLKCRIFFSRNAIILLKCDF